MARRSKYSPEFRERSIRVARESDRSIAAVAHDLGIHPETLRVWVRQDEANDGTRTDRLTTAEREELTALRREIRDLKRSTEILKAASVFFARELDQPRPRWARSWIRIAAASGSSRYAGRSRRPPQRTGRGAPDRRRPGP